jgi:hypothetical protein
MALMPVCCPPCRETHVVKRGKTGQGKQGYVCLNGEVRFESLRQRAAARCQRPEIDRAINGSGYATRRGCCRSTRTRVTNGLKKESCPEPVNRKLLESLNTDGVVVALTMSL